MIEKDPHGKDPHEAGAKLDKDKNRLGLVLGGFPRALQAVGEVGTYGANKYSDNGWMHVDSGQQRYMDAMLRHVFKDFAGETCDPDTQLLHKAHAAWNALAVLELALRDSEKPCDREVRGVDTFPNHLSNEARLQRSAGREQQARRPKPEADISNWGNIVKD